MLEAHELTKYYGMRPVLRNLSLRIEPGEFVAVLGPNGAGKTTLLRVVATLARPDAGTLTVGGVNALEQPARARALIGVVSHQPLVYPDLTAAENLHFYARMYGIGVSRVGMVEHLRQPPISDLQPLVDTVLRRVDLLPRAHEPVRTFSRGMVQRLAIARAVLHDPPLLLFDEPYTGLDHVSARNLTALLRDLAVSGRTVLMTTHELGRGLEGVTRAVVLKAGRVIAELHDMITPDRIARLFE
ncbi:MAG: heme ABC exporter ATP-binding protein CcmA [Chloroflexi bacterium]|nr:heme ABC exporter ATP-binding protein CcmA [Chloroflexota bacterium]